uniref:Uncharacterized protein n=1 Tax=Steinernema glaseri TaxID=37863 RepID=A0A1I8AKF5_9BILA
MTTSDKAVDTVDRMEVTVDPMEDMAVLTSFLLQWILDTSVLVGDMVAPRSLLPLQLTRATNVPTEDTAARNPKCLLPLQWTLDISAPTEDMVALTMTPATVVLAVDTVALVEATVVPTSTRSTSTATCPTEAAVDTVTTPDPTASPTTDANLAAKNLSLLPALPLSCNKTCTMSITRSISVNKRAFPEMAMVAGAFQRFRDLVLFVRCATNGNTRRSPSSLDRIFAFLQMRPQPLNPGSYWITYRKPETF